MDQLDGVEATEKPIRRFHFRLICIITSAFLNTPSPHVFAPGNNTALFSRAFNLSSALETGYTLIVSYEYMGQ